MPWLQARNGFLVTWFWEFSFNPPCRCLISHRCHLRGYSRSITHFVLKVSRYEILIGNADTRRHMEVRTYQNVKNKGNLCQNFHFTNLLITFDLPLRFRWYLVQIYRGCILYRWKPEAFCSRFDKTRLPAIYVVKIVSKCRWCHFGGDCIVYNFADKFIITDKSILWFVVLHFYTDKLNIFQSWCTI